MESVLLICALSLATASVSYTLTKTPVFDFVRDWLPPGLWYALWTCPYCMGHWVAAFFVLAYRPQPLGLGWFDLIPVMFVVVTLQTFLIQAIVILGRLAAFMKRFEGQH